MDHTILGTISSVGLGGGGITVLCHFRKIDLIPVIICKNDKHLVTLCNVIFFKYYRHPVTFEVYLPLIQEYSNVPLS